MKTTITILAMCLYSTLMFGQENFELSIKEDSKESISKSEHFYLLKLKNTSNQSSKINIEAISGNCSNLELSKQSALNYKVINKDKNKTFETLTVQPGKSIEFYIKINRNNTTKLGTWNCANISAVSTNGTKLSNTITIKSLIPNPKNFN
jgi:hypothetical protein